MEGKYMDWHDEYKRKLVSAEEAVKVVKSGDRVSFGFPQQPALLTAALAARSAELENVDIFNRLGRLDFPRLITPTAQG